MHPNFNIITVYGNTAELGLKLLGMCNILCTDRRISLFKRVGINL